MPKSKNFDPVSPRMRINEVAKILACSRSHVYDLISRGVLRKFTEGCRFSYCLREEVWALATGGLTNPSSEGTKA